MSRVLDFRIRNPKVRAMRIILGETTRTQILEFCPTANVGCGTRDGSSDDINEKDIRWVYVSDDVNGSGELGEDGEWLVQLPTFQFEFLSDTEFHLRYEASE